MCSLILQEEKRRNIGQSFNLIQLGDFVAMYVNNSRGFISHQGKKNGGKGGNGKKDRPVCNYCGFTGHIADKCYKLHGYPPPPVTSQKEVTRPWQIRLLQGRPQGVVDLIQTCILVFYLVVCILVFWLEELCKVLVFNQIWPYKTILVTLVEVLLCKLVHSYHCHKLNVSNF